MKKHFGLEREKDVGKRQRVSESEREIVQTKNSFSFCEALFPSMATTLCEDMERREAL